MAWYIAHSVWAVKIIGKSNQIDIPVWENVFLIQAENPDDAYKLAEDVCREREPDIKEVTLDGEPAEHVFIGIRKINGKPEGSISEVMLKHGEEITYSQFEVANESDIEKFVQGEEITLKYID